jgi:RND family efflux transporter MFP subunit
MKNKQWSRSSGVVLVGVMVALQAVEARASAFECLMEAWQVVEIRSPAEGLIDKVLVQRGDSIRKGQPLVELQSAVERSTAESARYRSQMEGAIAQSRNRVDYATKKLARATDLAQQNFVSIQARDEAEAERRIAQSELQAGLENRELAKIEHRRALDLLNLRTMLSPFNGVVVDRLLNPGDIAEAGTGRKAMLKIAQIDPLRVDVVFPASLFGQLKPGMKATVIPLGLPGRHVAVVKWVDKVVDAASATFVARLELPNPTQTLPGGLRCQAEFEGITMPAVAPPKAPGARLP